MGTKIEWTDETWNPITGCSVHSPGCTNCYAMQLAGTRLKNHESRAGLTREVNGNQVWTGEVRFNEQWLDQPLRWKKPRMIFVCAHGDLFHEDVPDEWIDRVFAVMALAPQHTFQVLTKRSDRMREYCEEVFGYRGSRTERWLETKIDPKGEILFSRLPGSLLETPLPNVWLGVSVEDQKRADERIPDLLATPAAVRWLSCEPLLGAVSLTHVHHDNIVAIDALDGRVGFPVPHEPSGHRGVDWVVVGGESGRNARPMHPDWARSLRDQCAAAEVPFFFKQWGNFLPAGQIPDTSDYPRMDPAKPWSGPHPLPTTKKFAGRNLDGRTHDAMPEATHG